MKPVPNTEMIAIPTASSYTIGISPSHPDLLTICFYGDDDRPICAMLFDPDEGIEFSSHVSFGVDQMLGVK